MSEGEEVSLYPQTICETSVGESFTCAGAVERGGGRALLEEGRPPLRQRLVWVPEPKLLRLGQGGDAEALAPSGHERVANHPVY